MQYRRFLNIVFVLLLVILKTAHGRQRHRRERTLNKSTAKVSCRSWKKVSANRFPFICTIHDGKSKKKRCSGTLIQPEWVLASAHCLDSEPSSAKQPPPIVLCGIDAKKTKKAIKKKKAYIAKDVHLHELWTGDVEDGYDIAVLKLDRAANITLPKMKAHKKWTHSEKVLVAIDWEMDASGKKFKGVRMSPEMQMMNHSDCKKHHGHARKERSICADELKDLDRWSCDAGAPLLIADAPDGNISEGSPCRDRILGIPSFGIKGHNTTLPGLYTNVEFFLSWITNLTEPKLKESSSSSSSDNDEGDDDDDGQSTKSLKEDIVSEDKTTRMHESIPGAKRAPNNDLLQEMIDAIRSDNGIEAEAILSNRLDVDTTYYNTRLRDYPLTKNSTLLHWAACYDAAKCVKVFLKHDATLEWTNTKKLTPLHTATLCGSRSAVKVLLGAGAEVEAIDTNRWTPLHMASLRGDLPIVKYLVVFGANVHASTRFGLFPLHEASFGGHVQIVEFLIAYGAVVDVIDDTGSTPLHFASAEGRVGVVKVLVANEANVHTINLNKWTALHEASRNGHFDIIKFLIANDADVDATNQMLWTSLHLAADGGHVQTVKILISHEADTDAMTNDGWTPLHLAASKGHLNVVQALADAGASKSSINRDGAMPLDLICDSFSADCTFETQAALVSLLSP